MKSLDKDFDKEIMMATWHEIDCPAGSIRMRPEKECNCIYGLINKKIRDFIRKREKELLNEIYEAWKDTRKSIQYRDVAEPKVITMLKLFNQYMETLKKKVEETIK